MQHGASLPPQGLAGRQRLQALVTIVMGIVVAVFDGTAIPLALPAMTRELGISGANAIWIVNGFQLAALAALLPLAQWGDRFTYRRVYLAGTALWGIASLIGCVAQSLPLLIVARVVQGVGAAGIMAVNMALVRLTWPPALLGRGVALNSMAVSLSMVAGPVVAAAILSVVSWRWLFAVNLPACALLLALGWRSLPANPPARGGRPASVVDMALNAALFIALFLAADSFGRSVRSGAGLWTGGWLLLLGLAVGIVHVRRQRRQPQPLLPVDLLQIPVFRLSMMTSVGGFAAQTMAFISLPFLLLEVWHASASQAGWLMACWPAGTLVAAMLASRWIGRYHDGLLGAVGLGALTAGMAVLAAAAFAVDLRGAVAWGLALCGIGFGLFQSPNNHTIMSSAPGQRSGAASGMLGAARLTGQTLGATLVALVFSIEAGISAQALTAVFVVAGVLAAAASVTSVLRTRHPVPLRGAVNP